MKAYTIIELIMTLVLISIVIWIGIASLLSGIDTWGFFYQRKDILSDGRMGLDRMLREIRMVGGKTSVTTAAATLFRFRDAAYNDMIFTLYPGGRVVRMKNDIVNYLLGNVVGLTFTYYDANGSVITTPIVAPAETNIRRIRIEIVLSKGTSRTLNLRSDVWPRNL